MKQENYGSYEANGVSSARIVANAWDHEPSLKERILDMKRAGRSPRRLGPKKDALMVTSDSYYRQRADVDRALKGHPPVTATDIPECAEQRTTCTHCLTALRELEGLTIKELAEKAQIPESEVSQIERVSLQISLFQYLKIAKALGVKTKGILDEKKTTPK